MTMREQPTEPAPDLEEEGIPDLEGGYPGEAALRSEVSEPELADEESELIDALEDAPVPAEEAAVRVLPEDRAPGVSWDESPDYIEDEAPGGGAGEAPGA
jgi:hypothetical protein